MGLCTAQTQERGSYLTLGPDGPLLPAGTRLLAPSDHSQLPAGTLQTLQLLAPFAEMNWRAQFIWVHSSDAWTLEVATVLKLKSDHALHCVTLSTSEPSFVSQRL